MIAGLGKNFTLLDPMDVIEDDWVCAFVQKAITKMNKDIKYSFFNSLKL